MVEGHKSFRPDAEHNPGRMNFFSLGEVSVVMDLAHNAAGVDAMVEIMNGVRRPGARACSAPTPSATGGRPARTAGRDRRDERRPRRHRPQADYLRGRTRTELDGMLRRP